MLISVPIRLTDDGEDLGEGNCEYLWGILLGIVYAVNRGV
jgi:hypothetical protein